MNNKQAVEIERKLQNELDILRGFQFDGKSELIAEFGED
jgi:hypothetical protein